MILSLPKGELLDFVAKQCEHFFPDGYKMKGRDIDAAFDMGLQRLEYCFKHITLRGVYG